MTEPANTRIAKLTPRRRERRERILSITQQLVADHGANAVTMRTIAQASDTAEKTLYNLFGTKDRLIATVARERSATVFQAAVEAAPEGGWAMLHSVARIVAELTLADPPMARALATILVDHGDLVGLQDIYASRITIAIDQMIAEGLISPPPSRLAIIRQIRLSVVAAVVFWANGEIGDAELAPTVFLKLGEPFLPFVIADRSSPIWRDMRAAHQNLARLHPDD